MHAPLVDEHVIILVKVGGVRGFHAVHIDFQVVAFVGSMYGYLCTRWELDVECIIEMRLDVVLVKHLLGRKQGEVLRLGKSDLRPDAVVEQPESMSAVVVMPGPVVACLALIACACAGMMRTLMHCVMSRASMIQRRESFQRCINI